MGNFSSKLFNKSSTSIVPETIEEPKEPRKTKVLINDPRSPTEGVARTPIVVSQKPYLETDFDWTESPCMSTYKNAAWPLSKRIYKNLGIDPNTPGFGADFPEDCRRRTGNQLNFDSPLSTYSYNCSQMDNSDITAPAEPSAIVSDFESNRSDLEVDYQETFLKQIDDLIVKLTNESLHSSHSSTSNKTLSQHSPTVTQIEEIVNDDICIPENIEKTEKEEVIKVEVHTVKNTNENKRRKSNIPKKTDKENVKIKNEKEISPKSKIPIISKPRTPLGNITSAHNSPVQILKVRKSNNFKKHILSNGNENMNLVPSNNKVLGEWDNENTIII